MHAHGVNKFIPIDIFEEEKEEKEFNFIVPDEYMQKESEYCIGVVKTDNVQHVTHQWQKGDLIVFPRAVLQKFEFKGEEHYLVQENYVICYLTADQGDT